MPFAPYLATKDPHCYGGTLFRTRYGRRRGGRPLALRHQGTVHLVLRSSLARGDWSLRRHGPAIDGILRRFAARHSVRIHTYANAGNHLHLHVRLSSRANYKAFIRAISGAIAMAVTKASRWSKTLRGRRFWDLRPFTRLVTTRAAFERVQDYVTVNFWEGTGLSRAEARLTASLERIHEHHRRRQRPK